MATSLFCLSISFFLASSFFFFSVSTFSLSVFSLANFSFSFACFSFSCSTFCLTSFTLFVKLIFVSFALSNNKAPLSTPLSSWVIFETKFCTSGSPACALSVVKENAPPKAAVASKILNVDFFLFFDLLIVPYLEHKLCSLSVIFFFVLYIY